MKKKIEIIQDVNIGEIELVETNANFMTQEVFNQLVENIKRDGQLTSTIFCIPKVEGEYGKYIVISGNHRLQAAKMAGLSAVPIMLGHELTEDQILGIQISHNELHGEDDVEVLKQLLDRINSVDYKTYTGVDESKFAELDKFEYDIVQPTNDIVTMNFTFVDSDLSTFEEIIDEIEVNGDIENTVLMPKEVYEKFQKTISKVQTQFNFKAYGLSVIKMMELARKQLDYESKEKEDVN